LYNILTEFRVPIKLVITQLFNFTLEYDIIKDQKNQMGLKLSRTHQLLVYTDDVNLLGDNTYTIKKNINFK
jgi:hypothetical protein